jgi:amino acid adenylation domain-containing protein
MHSGEAMGLASQQVGIWLDLQRRPECSDYNLGFVIRLRGRLDTKSVVGAHTALLERHAALRTVFGERDGVPFARVLEELPPTFTEEPASGLSLDALRVRVQERLEAPFDPTRACVGCHLFRVAEDDALLLFRALHLVMDGTARDTCVADFAELLRAARTGEPPVLPDLAEDYASFVGQDRALRSSERAVHAMAYWQRRLDDAPGPLDLAFGRHGDPLGDSVTSTLAGAPSVRAAKTLRTTEGVSFFTTLLAATFALLHRHSGQNDIVVGVPVDCRSATHRDVVGHFVNLLAVRLTVEPTMTFRELLRSANVALREAMDQKVTPFFDVARVAPSLGTTLQTTLRLVRAPRRPDLARLHLAEDTPSWQVDFGGLVGEPGPLLRQQAGAHPLSFLTAEVDGELIAETGYRRDAFERDAVERLTVHFRTLFEAAVSLPDRPIHELPLMSEAERERIVVTWNATARPLPRVRIERLFGEQAKRRPDAVALVMGDATMAYGELARAATNVARRLRAAGVERGARVGICAARSMDQIAGLLGILEAGAAYVPLDSAYPRERLELLVREAGVDVVLDPKRDLPPLGNVRVMTRGNDAGDAPIAESQHTRDAAYVLFTSGSTGTPKGVVVDHRAVIRLVHDVGWTSFTTDAVFLAFAPLSFDASTLEIWGPLLNGGKLVIAPPGHLDLDELLEQIERHRVSFLWVTSGLFHSLVDDHLPRLAGVKQLFTGGGVLSPSHVRRLRVELPHVRLVNGYGPTENTTFTTTHEIGDVPEGRSVPIGVPVTNSTVYVLDPFGSPTPIGVAGELYAGGAGVALGYLRARDTAERFVPDPFASEADARMYRTGDRARWLPEGVLEFLGRVDDQIKIRGFRIEPGEIATALGSRPEVREAVVVARAETSGKRLVAYVTPAPGHAVNVDTLRDALRESLPDYMVPSAFVVLEKLPLTRNGKVDPKALPAPPALEGVTTYVAPRTAAEERVAALFREVLKRPHVGALDDFFQSGGDSILTMRLAALAKRAGLALTVKDVWATPTVEALARRLAATPSLGALDSPAARPSQDMFDDEATREGLFPLSLQMNTIWETEMASPGGTAWIDDWAFVARDVDPARFTQALRLVIERHEVLRTDFELVGATPRFRVRPPRGSQLEEIDGRAAANPIADATKILLARAGKPMNLVGDDLFRIVLVRTNDREVVGLVRVHHIVFDLDGRAIVLREAMLAYEGLLRGETAPLPPLPMQYRDYVRWQREQYPPNDLRSPALLYWKEALAGAREIPLPKDAAGTLKTALPAPTPIADGLAKPIADLAARAGASPFSVFAAVLATWLVHLTESTDITVLMPSGVARAELPELREMAGHFTTQIPIRLDAAGDPTFLELVERSAATLTEALVNVDLRVQEMYGARYPVGSPLGKVILNYIIMGQPAETPGGAGPRVQPFALPPVPCDAKAPLAWAVMPVDGTFKGYLLGGADCFEHGTVKRFANELGAILARAVERSDAPISMLRGSR